ncbi:MAG: YhbY family RNA-binding protein [Clostridia bacterium]|nr:YhbY family RNA-binding protein [Clostridia bacterium]
MINSKQRAYLKSLAQKEDTILIVGKSNIVDNIITQADKALTARELIKGKVLESSEITVLEAANEIAQKTNAIVVQTIGSKFVLYRRNEDKPKIELPKK